MIYVNAIDDVVEKAGCERSGQQASLEKKIAASVSAISTQHPITRSLCITVYIGLQLNGLILTLAHPHLVASCILYTVVEVERKSEQD
ncbi:hypothetical protein T12_2373 [Trichinella patagoniensis]|uniref:Uncharacterized protein n=1 Tax=Trichinella patagoniensis TaxID=990121 RepID=A0A0V0ZS59_9BILA|nr:hypothetical protein T12_2373 [Trichinella patagoniensis]